MMDPIRIGILYANGMLTNGYVSIQDIQKAMSISTTGIEEHPEFKLCEIDEITKDNLADKLSDSHNKVDLYMAVGDDASIILYDHTSKNDRSIPWISVLASTKFDNETSSTRYIIPKFWFSQSYEISIYINFLIDFFVNNKGIDFKCCCLNTAKKSLFSTNLVNKFYDAIKNRYTFQIDLKEYTDTEKLEEEYEEYNVIFVSGLGDDNHVSVIEKFLNLENKIILTNAAILNKKSKLDNICNNSSSVICVDVDCRKTQEYFYKEEGESLQIKLFTIAFDFLCKHDSAKDFTNFNASILSQKFIKTKNSNGIFGFDDEGYLSLPLTAIVVKKPNEEGNILYKQPDPDHLRISIIDSLNVYEEGQFIRSVNDLTSSNDPQESIDGLLSLIETSYKECSTFASITHNRINIYNGDDEILELFKNCITSLATKDKLPIQINLTEEDALDNNTYRLCLKNNTNYTFPIGWFLDLGEPIKDKRLYLTRNIYDKNDHKQIILDVYPDKILNKIKDIQSKTECKYIYLFPYQNCNNNGVAFLLVASRGRYRYIDINLIQVAVNLLFSHIYAKFSQKDIQQESIKSAVVAIMSRNMSHNLGSHYLYYTKAHLEQLAAKGGNIGPDIRGAAKVLGYMQARMDYLATIISNERYPYGGVNFKSQIFDELTIDDFSKRHETGHDALQVESAYKLLDSFAELEKSYNKVTDISITGDEYIQATLQMKELIAKIGDQSNAVLASSRTTNFLLTNLILSENISRPDILEASSDNTERDQNKMLRELKLRVLYDGKEFTGSAEADKKRTENEIKNLLSNVNVALPGGAMSCHAFFNVVENFIRNSAKYEQEAFKEELLITIAITGRKDEDIDSYEFTIFDNKQNAFNLCPLKYAGKRTPENINISTSWLYYRPQVKILKRLINNKLRELIILNDKNTVDKNNKGFKEMLFSALWMRSYTFFNEDKSYANILSEIQSASGDKKLELINKYGFKVVSVDSNGKDCDKIDSNIGIRFTLPQYKRSVTLKLDNELEKIKKNSLNTFGDIVKIEDDNNFYEEYKVYKWFPRMVKGVTDNSDVALLKEIFRTRFGESEEKYALCITGEKSDSAIPNDHTIFMDRHLSSKSSYNLNELGETYAYVDSISGGDFTITLSDWYSKWLHSGKDTNSDTYYNILKIKEAALTRITIIDERLSNKADAQKRQELKCRNIRVINAVDKSSDVIATGDTEVDKFRSLFEQACFMGEKNPNTKPSHFISIHLGLIEKLVGSKAFIDMCGDKEQATVDKFMMLLREAFGNNDTFISVHSGRGNFSAELETSLKDYPFIGLATLENAYNNSKYLLCQLLYNTVYIGKGEINKH